jgi:hypothetical protein
MYLRGKRYENEKRIITNKDGNNQYIKEFDSQNDQQPKYDYPNNTTARKRKEQMEICVRTFIIEQDLIYH